MGRTTMVTDKDILACWKEEYSMGETARICGCSVAYVKKRLVANGAHPSEFSCSAAAKRRFMAEADGMWDQILSELRRYRLYEEIAVCKGITKRRFLLLCRRHGVDYVGYERNVRANRKRSRDEQVLTYRRDGKTIPEIAFLVQKSERTVSRILQEYGLTEAGDRSDIKEEDVVSAWKNGLSVHAIAKSYDCADGTVAKRLDCSPDTKERRLKTRDGLYDDRWSDDYKERDLETKMSRLERDLDFLGIAYRPEDRKVLTLNGMMRETSLFLPDHRLVIAVNPVWMCNTDSYAGCISVQYQQERALQAREDGNGLLELYDEDFADDANYAVLLRQLGGLAQKIETVDAKQCDLSELSRAQANAFLRQYDFQGMENSSFVCYGLLYRGRVLAVMTFGRSRCEKNQYELVRYCEDPAYTVADGFVRMLEQFTADHMTAGQTVTAYADLDKQIDAANVFEEHGFACDGTTQSGYAWVSLDGSRTVRRYEAMKFVSACTDPSVPKTERAVMQRNGYLRVYHAGSLRYRLC